MISSEIFDPGGAASARTAASNQRYGAVSMLLHWLLALLILGQIGLGWYMNKVLPDHTPAQESAETLHISVGLTILVLVLVRIGNRLMHPAPPLPADLAPWERHLAHLGHVLFYVLMLALPLTGWALVSSGARPIHFWGLPWPHLPGVSGVFGGPTHRDMREQLAGIHTDILVWITLANLALHVAGALKHQFDGHPVLWRMSPLFRPPKA